MESGADPAGIQDVVLYQRKIVLKINRSIQINSMELNNVIYNE